MANNKRKDLNIGSFLNEVKADSTGSQRLASPTTDPEPQSPSAPMQRGTTEMPMQGIAYPTVGRPAKRQSLLSKKLAKLVYIDEETELQLKLIKTFQNYDYKEVIFTAVHEFMERHYHDMRLDEPGVKKVERIIKEYKTRC